jgi:hypothetical protein
MSFGQNWHLFNGLTSYLHKLWYRGRLTLPGLFLRWRQFEFFKIILPENSWFTEEFIFVLCGRCKVRIDVLMRTVVKFFGAPLPWQSIEILNFAWGILQFPSCLACSACFWEWLLNSSGDRLFYKNFLAFTLITFGILAIQRCTNMEGL